MSARLRVNGLGISVRDANTWRSVLDDVTFSVSPKQTLALVGESGSGKSLLASACLNLLPRDVRIDGGSIRLDDVEVLDSGASTLTAIRGAKLGLVPEDPRASLDPNCSVRQLVARVAQLHGLAVGTAQERADDLLTRLGFAETGARFDLTPSQLSEGDCQRLAITLALLNRPSIVLLDEPMAALDATSQGLVIDTLDAIRASEEVGFVLITHDLGLVPQLAQDMAVMYAGQIVEYGPLQSVLDSPAHPYTLGLLQSIPPMRPVGPPELRRLPTIPGSIDHHTAKDGCPFRLRCAYRQTQPTGFERCDGEAPQLLDVRLDHAVRCHFSEDFLT